MTFPEPTMPCRTVTLLPGGRSRLARSSAVHAEALALDALTRGIEAAWSSRQWVFLQAGRASR